MQGRRRHSSQGSAKRRVAGSSDNARRVLIALANRFNGSNNGQLVFEGQDGIALGLSLTETEQALFELERVGLIDLPASGSAAMTQRAFTKSYLDVLESDAWRSLGINARRLIDFLMIEHMRHGGRRNGFLLAPWRQLVECGIGDHFIESAIAEVEQAGLVDCRRGTGRSPNMYTLTWLPLSDGTPPSDRWRHAVLPAKQQADRLLNSRHKARSACQTAGTKAKNLPAKQQALYRSSYQDGAVCSDLSVQGSVVGNGHLSGKWAGERR